QDFIPNEIGFSTYRIWKKDSQPNVVNWRFDRCEKMDECGYKAISCKPDDAGYKVCNCQNGFTVKDINARNPSCTDIDECQSNNGNGDCDHNCMNSQGSYNCSCKEGFEIKSDRKSCQDIN
ncbi:unnamed protein product, partial [Meganyctiphanes norvegica]